MPVSPPIRSGETMDMLKPAALIHSSTPKMYESPAPMVIQHPKVKTFTPANCL